MDRSKVGTIMEEASGLVQLMRDWKSSLVKLINQWIGNLGAPYSEKSLYLHINY